MSHSAAPAPSSGKSKPNKGLGVFVRDILIIFVAALLISFLIKTFLVRSFYIPSASMQNTLQINDRIVVNELVPDLVPIQHGDVVVFQDPGGWLPPAPPSNRSAFAEGVDTALGFIGLTAPDSNDHLVKRAIGLPGDTVECCNDEGQLLVNGVPLDEPYILLPEGTTQATRDEFTVTVPKGYLWLMGDNRFDSADSAYHRNDSSGGFVPMDKVVGRAFLTTWPLSHWTWLDDYPETFKGVDKD